MKWASKLVTLLMDFLYCKLFFAHVFPYLMQGGMIAQCVEHSSSNPSVSGPIPDPARLHALVSLEKTLIPLVPQIIYLFGIIDVLPTETDPCITAFGWT